MVGQDTVSRAVAAQGSHAAASRAEVCGQALSFASAGGRSRSQDTRDHACTSAVGHKWLQLAAKPFMKTPRDAHRSPGFREETLMPSDIYTHTSSSSFPCPQGEHPNSNSKGAKQAGCPLSLHCCLMTFLIISEPDGPLPSLRHDWAVPCSCLDKKCSAEQCPSVRCGGDPGSTEQRLEETSKGMRDQNLPLQRASGKKIAEPLIPGASACGRGAGKGGSEGSYGRGQQEWGAKDKPYLHFPSWSQQPWARLQRSLQSSPTRQEMGGS